MKKAIIKYSKVLIKQQPSFSNYDNPISIPYLFFTNMITPRVDYAATYFLYPKPTPIQGEPTYKALKRLKNELRANSSSVDSDLGGGDHGYLGLVLNEQEYSRVAPNTPFIAPMFPGPLNIPRGTDTIDAINIRKEHKRNLGLYRECREVEKALVRHITTAIESKYLDYLKNPDTHLIEDDIPSVLQYLFDNYGKVPTRIVKEQEQEVLSTPFVPSDPMVTIFRPIEQLRTLAEIAKIPYTESQIVDFGVQLIKSTRDYETALGEWNKKTDQEKTWELFKEHFTDAQRTLKDIRGPTMAQAGFHHANLLASEIRSELQENQEKMFAIIKNLHDTEPTHDNDSEEQQESVNAVNSLSVQTETLKVLTQLQEQLKRLTNEVKYNRSKKRQNRKTPDDASFNRTNTDHYCWTHGMCNHKSNACTHQAPGHKSDATKDNKQGESKAFCN